MIRLVSFLFAAMAFLSPWFIGGNYPFTRTGLIAGSGLALLLIAVEIVMVPRRSSHKSVKIPWIWWVLLLGVAFTAFQASPLSSSVQARFGTQDVAGFAGDAASPSVAPGDRVAKHAPNLSQRPISTYAPATRSKLVDLLYGVGLFVCATLVLRDARSFMPVLASLAVVGVLVSFVGVLQILSGDSRVLWMYELLWGGGPFASFVNSNNAAGFLLICFSAIMFYVAKVVLRFGEHDQTISGNRNYGKLGARQTTIKRILRAISKLQSHHLYCLTAIVVVTAGVMMTGSRSGMLALVASIVVSGLMLSRSSLPAVIGLSLALVVCSVVVVKYSEQSDRVSGEIQTLTDFSNVGAPRLKHWEDAIPFGFANVLLGTGNGTYRYVSPGFQKQLTVTTFAHAENVYIETLVETGVGGVLLLLLCISYCFYASLSLFRQTEFYDQALAVSGMACLTGQVAIATLDFGIYQPANSTAMALMMGAVVGRHITIVAGVRAQQPGAFSRFVRFGVVGLLLLATCWAGYESWGIESRRSAKRSIKLLNQYASEGPRKTRQISLAAVKKQLEQAEKIRPDDSGVQLLFGDLQVSLYRLQKAKEMSENVREQLEGLNELDISVDERKALREQLEMFDSATIWNSTAVSLIHQQLRASQRTAPKIAKEILGAPGIKEHLDKAYNRFRQADDLCPQLASTRVRLAQLAAFRSLSQAEDTFKEEENHIEVALSRTIPKTQTLFNCGLLALNSGKQDLAVELWQKCLRQPHLYSHERAIVEFCMQMMPMRRLYEEVFPQDAKYLLKIARRYMSSKDLMLPKKFLVLHIRRLINQTDGLEELEKNLLLAQAAGQIDDYPEVAKHYRAVLSLASSPAPWRYDYAFALFKTKQFDEAVRQLKVCELDPSFRKNRIKWLLDRIRKERSKRTS